MIGAKNDALSSNIMEIRHLSRPFFGVDYIHKNPWSGGNGMAFFQLSFPSKMGTLSKVRNPGFHEGERHV
jgi:hypothetical protein